MFFLVSPHLAGFEDCTFFKVHSPVTENKAIEGYSQETHWGKTGFFFFQNMYTHKYLYGFPE